MISCSQPITILYSDIERLYIYTENYICDFLSRHQRSLIAQLRTGILPLHIETGRYYRTPLEQRTCKVCRSNQIEDEYHFLCECTFFFNERRIFYENIYTNISENVEGFENLIVEEKFNCLMKANPKQLAQYVEKIWNIRRNVIMV